MNKISEELHKLGSLYLVFGFGLAQGVDLSISHKFLIELFPFFRHWLFI